MKQKRDITFISIQESRYLHSHMPPGQRLKFGYFACIQENVGDNYSIRGYRCSHWSIKRLAKIQEKLAQ